MSRRLLILLLLGHTVSTAHAGIFGGRVSPAIVEVKDTEIAVKSGILSTTAEAIALIGILELSRQFPACKWNPIISGMPIVRWVCILAVVFGSSAIRSALDGTMLAVAQTLQPTIVPGDSDWYDSLEKPFFNPPAWVFPIMWLLIAKPTQVLALKELFSATAELTSVWKYCIPYAIHLSLGDTWNQVFFQHQRIGLAAIVIACFWTTLGVSILSFDSVSEISALCLLPSLGWITIASLLNLEIYRLNPPRQQKSGKRNWFGRR